MPRLFEFFAPVFSAGLELEERLCRNPDEVAADPHGAPRAAIDQARAAALAAGKRPEHVEFAVFAVVAWIDEVIAARRPAHWAAGKPLQVVLFNTNNAGNEFFHGLSGLKSEDDEVREIYYHALLLGFVGQYYFESGDGGDLGKLKEQHARQLPVTPVPTHTLREDRVTPQPYQAADPVGPLYPRQWDRVLLAAGIALAVLIPLVYLAWLLAHPDRGPTIAERVDRQLREGNYACSQLDARVGADDTVAVKGWVSVPEDVGRVKSDIAAIPGVRSPTFDLGLRIWPHCEVVAILGPYRERNLQRHQGLQVTPTAGHTDRFTQGEQVTVSLRQAVSAGYLYVDYYTVDRQVIHLYPNSKDPNSVRSVGAGVQLDVGRDAGLSITVSPPFGQELITIISSPTPLYKDLPPLFEPAKDYVPRLRQMVAASGAREEFAANFMFLQTEPGK